MILCPPGGSHPLTVHQKGCWSFAKLSFTIYELFVNICGKQSFEGLAPPSIYSSPGSHSLLIASRYNAEKSGKTFLFVPTFRLFVHMIYISAYFHTRLIEEQYQSINFDNINAKQK